jgi:hypothetical protein
LDFTSGLFPLGFPTSFCVHLSCSTCSANLNFLELMYTIVRSSKY